MSWFSLVHTKPECLVSLYSFRDKYARFCYTRTGFRLFGNFCRDSVIKVQVVEPFAFGAHPTPATICSRYVLLSFPPSDGFISH